MPAVSRGTAFAKPLRNVTGPSDMVKQPFWPGSKVSRTPKRAAKATWLAAHGEALAKADELISGRLANRKHFARPSGAETLKVVEEILNNVLTMGPAGSENNSVLLLGEGASGKTHVVEHCVQELQKRHPATVVLRARGSAYATDVECLRHLATQMTDRLAQVPHANASFKAGMDWMRNIFRGSFQHGSGAVVLILDEFEHFCSRMRQTLLYNLFDIAQESGVHLCIVGTSEKMDVMESLEKRIRSRFSMRHLHTFLPTKVEEVVEALTTKLKVPPGSGLDAAFLREFHGHVEAALRAKQDFWRPHVELQRPLTWFLAQCLPVAALLYDFLEEAPQTPPAKRRKAEMLHMPSPTMHEVTLLLLDGLSEAEHMVLLALYRLHGRTAARTLSTMLHEVKSFHEASGRQLTHHFDADFYSAAFDRLLRLHLVKMAKSNASDTVAKRHLPCRSTVDEVYEELVQELNNPEAEPLACGILNPLRALPSCVQQWAVRQCPASAMA